VSTLCTDGFERTLSVITSPLVMNDGTNFTTCLEGESEQSVGFEWPGGRTATDIIADNEGCVADGRQ
jgi:hypothetical protein